MANHALTGRGAIDSTTAMTAHPLFDFVGWDEALAADAGTTPAALPDIVSGVEPAGRIRDGLVGAGALVGGGTIDAMGEQIVAGADAAGDVLVICGAHAHHVGRHRRVGRGPGPLDHPPHRRRHDDGRRPEQRRWALRRPGAPLGGDPDPAQVAAVDADDLPIWLPYLRGERTPLHRRDIRGSVQGLSLHHGPEHLMAAAFEASAFVARHHIDLARQAGLAPRRVVATGGGTNAAAWMQALADVTQLPVDVVAVPEGAALGSAFIARCVAGLEQSMTDARRWARTGRTVEPRAGRGRARPLREVSGSHAPTRWRRRRPSRLRAGTRSAASRP